MSDEEIRYESMTDAEKYRAWTMPTIHRLALEKKLLYEALDLGGSCPWCDGPMNEHVEECPLSFLNGYDGTEEWNDD